METVFINLCTHCIDFSNLEIIYVDFAFSPILIALHPQCLLKIPFWMLF